MASIQRGVIETLLDVVTTGTGSAFTVPNSLLTHVWYLIGSGTITGGTILIEEADDPTYADTWHTLITMTAADVTGDTIKTFRPDPATVPPRLSLRAVRARVSSNITGGGNITVKQHSVD